MFSSPYSPELKPIELGFANVKQYIRRHEVQALNDPIGYINQGFELYSIRGPHIDAGKFAKYCVYFSNNLLPCIFQRMVIGLSIEEIMAYILTKWNCYTCKYSFFHSFV
jgi:hypothetical protein